MAEPALSKTVFRGPTRQDVERQAIKGMSDAVVNQEVEISRTWSEADGQQVLTVIYEKQTAGRFAESVFPTVLGRNGPIQLTDPQWAAVAGVAGAAIAIAALLPWATVSAGIINVSRTGLDYGDGFGFVIGGIVIVLMGLSGATSGTPLRVRRPLLIAGIVAAIGAAIEIVNVFNNIQKAQAAAAPLTISVAVGIGLWLEAIGAVVVLVAAYRLGRTADEA